MLGLLLGRLRGDRRRAGARRASTGFVLRHPRRLVARRSSRRSPRRRAKGLFILLLLWWRRAELDGVLDGIVYAGMVGVGFAFTENILYLAGAYIGGDGRARAASARADRHCSSCAASFSPFAHPLFTAFTGIGVGIAVVAAQPRGARSSRRSSGTSLPWPPTRSGTPPPSSAAAATSCSTYLFADGAGVPRCSSASRSGRAAARAGCSTGALDRLRAGAGCSPPTEMPGWCDLPARRREPRATPRGSAARPPSGRCASTSSRPSSSASCTAATCAAPAAGLRRSGASDASQRLHALRPYVQLPAAGGPTAPVPCDRRCPVTTRDTGGRPAAPPRWSPRWCGCARRSQAAALPLELPGVEEHRVDARARWSTSSRTTCCPRLRSLDAPLLAVVGGSTGAGKSTLVNSLVGARVTEPGVLRPTTRSPVLVHHPADARLVRRRTGSCPSSSASTAADRRPRRAAAGRRRQRARRGWRSSTPPTSTRSRSATATLAAQLLAAADLWLFVTSAARYADQVPWDFLQARPPSAATAVAIVLDRTPADAVARGQRRTSPGC